MFSLNGKIALVTGAGSGIGASIAQVFAKAGARVIVCDIQSEAGKQSAEAITRGNGVAEFFPLDVSDENGARNVADQIHSKHGRLDILVNNAGIGHGGTMMQTTAGDLDRLYQVNVRGVFN